MNPGELEHEAPMPDLGDRVMLLHMPDDPDPIPAAADHLRSGFEGLMGESTWRWIVESLVSGQPTDAETGDWLPWLEAFGIARETAPGQVVCTDQGLTLLQLHHAHYTGGN